jgi:hypothetical protein
VNTTRRNFILTTAGGVLGALASSCAGPGSREKSTTTRPDGITRPARDISLGDEADLVVCGGGSGGFGAALAAARMGMNVVLVERADCLGGNSVRGGVNIWEPGLGGTGIPFELFKRLVKLNKAVGIYSFGRHMSWFNPERERFRYPGGETVIDPNRRYLDTLERHIPQGVQSTEVYRREHQHGVVFEPDAMARTMLAMLEETGRCRVRLNTAFVSAMTEADRVQRIQLSDGRSLTADYFVDATGDANLCVAVGCETMAGQEAKDRFGEPSAPTNATKRINGVSLLYRAAPKAWPGIEPLSDGIPTDCWWAKWFPVAAVNHYPNGDLNVNMLPTMDGAEFLQRGYVGALEECRRRVLAHWHDWQTRFPEFRGYRVSWTAPALGIRESRRIVGEYVLTEHDVRGGLSGQHHHDIITLADHPPDTHGSHAGGIGELREPYGVPYRCLIPRAKRNLLIACRAASFSPSFARPKLSACKQGLETFWHYKVAPVSVASFDCGNCFQFTLSL